MQPVRQVAVRSGAGILLVLSSLQAWAAAEPAGQAIYQTHCARCHDANTGTRVPLRSALAQLSAANIRKALESGVMKEQGAALTAQQKTDVANWLSSTSSSPQPAAVANACPAGQRSPVWKDPGWTNWGAGLENRRYQVVSGITPDDIPRLKLKWAFGVADAKMLRSQPVAYRGRVYLGTESGSVYALDANTGCAYWSAQVKNVRSGLTIGKAGAKDALFFGDATGVAHALDLETGTELWQRKVADHPTALITGTPAYEDGRLYVPLSSYEEVAVLDPAYHCCTFRGSLSALDSASGNILWRTHTIEETPTVQRKTAAGADVFGPSGASIWSSPTIDAQHHTIYVTTGDNFSDPATATSDAVLALDMQTGKMLWSKQFTSDDVYNLGCGKPGTGGCKGASGPDFDFGASPILVDLPARKRCLLLGQKSAMVYAIDPDDRGKILWQARAGIGGPLGGVQWGLATDRRLLFAAVSDLAFKEGATKGEALLDPKSGGGLSAFAVSSGELAWKAAPPVCAVERNPCSPAQSAALTAVAGAVFSGSLDGHLRAYSSKDGRVLWDFDTEQPVTTVNHVPAAGGSLDVAGPIVANGMLFVNSGYPQFGGKPGNVLLAFGID